MAKRKEATVLQKDCSNAQACQLIHRLFHMIWHSEHIYVCGYIPAGWRKGREVNLLKLGMPHGLATIDVKVCSLFLTSCSVVSS
jgi:hypothetical protein